MLIDMKQKVIFPIILLVLSTIVALLIGELTLRILKIGYGESPQNPHNVYHHVHPEEYRFVSYTPNAEYGGHEIYYNKEGLVSNPNSNIINDGNGNGNCRIVFLGDSFTEAAQVAYKNSFVGMVERYSKCEILNFGVSSYSPIFYLLQWRKIVNKYKPTLVVTQLYSNDMSADKMYMEIAKTNKDGKVVAISGPKSGYFKRQLRNSYLLRFLRKVQLQLLWMYKNESNEQNIVGGLVEENPDIPELSINIIDSLSKEVAASGAQFVLMVVPSKFSLLYPDIKKKSKLQFSDKWKLIAKKHNIPFLDLVEVFEKEAKNNFRLFFNKDIHFNENGHMLVASELSKAYPTLFKTINSRLIKSSDN